MSGLSWPAILPAALKQNIRQCAVNVMSIYLSSKSCVLEFLPRYSSFGSKICHDLVHKGDNMQVVFNYIKAYGHIILFVLFSSIVDAKMCTC